MSDIRRIRKYISKRNPGYNPNPEGVERWLNDHTNTHPMFGLSAHKMIRDTGKSTILMYKPLLKLHPSWQRGSQGIGDCVSWAYEIACTLLMAADITFRKEPELWKGEAATEPIYGGCRVEALGKRSGGWSDGAYGAAAAKWCKNYGVVLRSDYSKITGIKEHNLTKYNSKRAKNWGMYGCGGKGDDRLDQIAKQHPVKTTSMVTTFEEAAAAISNYYPVAVCSNQGFSSKRDSEGFARAQGSWSHAMTFIGVRYGKRPGLLCMNSWGHSCDGPTFPKRMPISVANCSWWVDASRATRMLSGQDSFALSGFDGFKRRKLDWSKV